MEEYRKTCTFSEYLDLIAPAQEEYIRKCTDGLTASAAHWAVNHQETWPYGLRDFTLGVVSSWDLDDVMDSKSYEEMPQKYGGSFDQAAERARQLGAARRTALYLAAKQLDVIGPDRKAAGSISKPRAPAGFTGGSPFSICSE